MFRERLKDRLEPTTSGHGSIDLIMPGCHKASGLKRLAARWGITPEQCAAFGDGGNDIEMLRYKRDFLPYKSKPQKREIFMFLLFCGFPLPNRAFS